MTAQAQTRARATAWHAMPRTEVLGAFDVDPAVGLTSAQVAERLQRYGLNRLREAPKEPRWHAFARQFQDVLILILLGAAAISALVSREWETPLAIGVVVLFNAILGFVQESRAEASLAALRTMLVVTPAVRRDGAVRQVPAEQLVPGDIVLLEAGHYVPADGRLLEAVRLQVQESALTGEAEPVHKDVAAVHEPEAPLADRTAMVFMNTVVTGGRGTFVVTGTGMDTEIGQIADLLRSAESERTPLQRQIDQLGRTLASIAGAVIAVVFVLGLIRGHGISDLFVEAVSLAVAAIPEGLPAVVAFTLAVGTTRLARRNAIVKRLASVETLGSTSQICTDKTGTLTLNQMTARVLYCQSRKFTISGEGYRAEGRILTTDGEPVEPMRDLFVGMALCTDASVVDGRVVGDPTEGALVVLAEKGGVDVPEVRAALPRIAELPFDSEYKFMATFHRWSTEDGREVVRCVVKGAPDVLGARSTRVLGRDGLIEFDDAVRAKYAAANRGLAEQGLRVLAIAVRDIDPREFDPAGDLFAAACELVLVGMVGILDPPRAEAKQAIDECRQAGIRVRMITGDHAVTAAAIARELGLEGRAVTGAELDPVSDEDLSARMPELGVFARVAPEHKIRLVRVLQRRGDVVAMTGDGVNDAPALRKADIGVAMGITGTDVTKEAATMILTDDNFATIVAAVEQGRGIYANIVKFVKFQLTTAFGFVLTFLVAATANIAAGVPFTPLQILFVNVLMDGPPALSLGVDPAPADAMDRAPRPRTERILTRSRLLRVLFLGGVMAAGTLAVLLLAPGPEPQPGVATTAGTLAFTTFVFFQVFNLLNVRSPHESVFSRETFANPSAFVATAAVVLLQVAVVNMDVLEGVFNTVELTGSQWLVAVAIASSVLWLEEARKFVFRRRMARP